MEKRTSPENKLALKRVLAQEGNGRCADCKTATHPRWASWNIGILICIRCSGIHRSLGTHISKVRSIDLDTWNEQQLEKLLAYGNTRANAYWEAKLKPGYVPDEAKIASFIKTKYELKRWVPEDDDTPLANVRPGLPPRVRPTEDRSNTGAARGAAPASQPTSADLLDLNGAFNVRSKPTTAPASALHGSHHHHHHKHHHFHLGQHHHGRAQQSQSHESSPQPAIVQPPPRPSSQPPRSDIKKSILALYADKQPSQTVSRSAAATPVHNSGANSLSGSLSDLSLGNNSFPPSQQPRQQPSPHQTQLSMPLSQSSRIDTDFDDEGFANVWQ